MTRQQMTKSEFRAQWMKAQEEIANLIHFGIEVQDINRRLYEGVMGETAPRYEPRLQWEEEDEAIAS